MFSCCRVLEPGLRCTWSGNRTTLAERAEGSPSVRLDLRIRGGLQGVVLLRRLRLGLGGQADLRRGFGRRVRLLVMPALPLAPRRDRNRKLTTPNLV